MADFNFVTHRVATGAAVTNDEDVMALIGAGVSHVVDCRGEFDDTALLASHPDIHYLYNGVADDGVSKPNEWFAKGIEFALDALSRPRTKVYAHCAAGVNRGPSMAYSILRALGLDPNTAENLIRSARPQVGIAYKGDANRAVFELGYDDADYSKPMGVVIDHDALTDEEWTELQRGLHPGG